LNGLKPTVSEVDLGSKGVFRRLRAGPFESRAAAHSTCQALQAANQKCFVVKN
jgi:cell division septation protein DedD